MFRYLGSVEYTGDGKIGVKEAVQNLEDGSVELLPFQDGLLLKAYKVGILDAYLFGENEGYQCVTQKNDVYLEYMEMIDYLRGWKQQYVQQKLSGVTRLLAMQWLLNEVENRNEHFYSGNLPDILVFKHDSCNLNIKMRVEDNPVFLASCDGLYMSDVEIVQLINAIDLQPVRNSDKKSGKNLAIRHILAGGGYRRTTLYSMIKQVSTRWHDFYVGCRIKDDYIRPTISKEWFYHYYFMFCEKSSGVRELYEKDFVWVEEEIVDYVLECA
jgi:hypothetical protein